jgi:hypothetical protein
MVTGELPYVAGNVHAMMRAKLNQDPRPPHEVFSGIDPKIEEIILHAVERSPRERYGTAKEMLADLENPTQVVPRDRSIRRDVPLLERIRVPRRLVMPAILVLVIGGLVLLTLSTSRRRQPPLPAGSRSGVGDR